MDNYEVKKEFKVSEVLELASTWYDCGTGFAAIVGKEVTRQFGRGSRFAGRECIMISKDGKKLTLGDWQGLDRFQALSREKVASFFDQGQEEKPAEKPAEKAAKKPVKKTSQASEKKPAQKAAKKPVKETGCVMVTLDHKDLQASPAAVKEKAIKKLTAAPAEKPAGRITVASLLSLARNNTRPIPSEFLQDYRKKYSAENIELLYLQAPNATAVNTYRAWLKAGRQVKKGEHGVKILAPRMVDKVDKNGNATRAIDGLRLVTLFSVDQTEKIESKEA